MGTTDNKPRLSNSTKLTKEQRLMLAQEYAKRFTFDTLSEEDLKQLRRNAYKYAI